MDKTLRVPPSDCSFTTAASPTDDVSRVGKNDDEVSATPRKSRKRWSSPLGNDFTFAEESGPPENLRPVAPTAEDEAGGSLHLEDASSSQADMTAVVPQTDGSEPSSNQASEDKESPQRPYVIEQRGTRAATTRVSFLSVYQFLLSFRMS